MKISDILKSKGMFSKDINCNKKIMTDIKNKIQEIKLARMGVEYQFVAKMFSDLETHVSKTRPHHIYFMKYGDPVMVYDKKANYLWCHYDIIWEPLLRLIQNKMFNDDYSIRKEMREILGHFALRYFNISDAIISMSHSYITETWKTLKFKRVYIW